MVGNPLGWVWGRTLDQGIEWAIQKKWLVPTGAFCRWRSEQSEAGRSESTSLASEEAASSSQNAASKNTGKEHVPEFE